MKKIYILIMCSLLATALHAQDGFGTYLRDVIQKQEKGILVTAKLIEACGLCDSLDVLMDYEYEKRYQTGQILATIVTWNITHSMRQNTAVMVTPFLPRRMNSGRRYSLRITRQLQ